MPAVQIYLTHPVPRRRRQQLNHPPPYRRRHYPVGQSTTASEPTIDRPSPFPAPYEFPAEFFQENSFLGIPTSTALSRRATRLPNLPEPRISSQHQNLPFGKLYP